MTQLTIYDVADIKKKWASNLALNGGELELNFEQIDTAGIQLLLALSKSAQQNQKKIQFISISEATKLAFENIGLNIHQL
jgi:anti-anti-sigma regulatory factor